MKQIQKDSANELTIVIRSPLEAWMGGATIFFLLDLLYTWLSRSSNTDRMIGLIGASATCGLFFLFFNEKCDFKFDLQTRLLTWSRRQGFSKRNGVLPFDAIGRVVLQSCMGNNKYYPKHRIVLLTSEGELPLTISYEYDDMNEIIAERIRNLLGTSSKSLIEDSVESLVAAGRNIDAIRLLREKSGISLTEAHSAVARIREDVKPPEKPS